MMKGVEGGGRLVVVAVVRLLRQTTAAAAARHTLTHHSACILGRTPRGRHRITRECKLGIGDFGYYLQCARRIHSLITVSYTHLTLPTTPYV